MLWLALVVVLAVLAAYYVTWLAGRIQRLGDRVEAAWSSLDAQLVRRAAAAAALAATADDDQLAAAAGRALSPPPEGRDAVENDLSRAIRRAGLPDGSSPGDPRTGDPRTGDPRPAELLAAAANRVGLARQFYNDAVRDLRALRGRRLARLLGLGSRRPAPVYFEIDDTARPRVPAR